MMYGGACMGKTSRAVSNAGPLIHLAEIDSLKAFSFCEKVLIPQEVYDELRKYEQSERTVRGARFMTLRNLSEDSKNLAKRLSITYELHLGEAAAITLAQQEGIVLFFTDDLVARLVAISLGFKVHGSVGILLRAFRENLLTKDDVVSKIGMLEKDSTLFITRDLIKYILREINEYQAK